jgi:N-acetyl sugar amidotransferase
MPPQAPSSDRRVILHVKEVTDVRFQSRFLKEARSALESGVFSEVVLACRWEPGWGRDEEVMTGVRVHRIPMMRGSSYPKLRRLRRWSAGQRLRRFGAISKPHLIECHNIETLEWCCAMKRDLRVPLVYAPHELETERLGVPELQRMKERATERSLIKECDAVVVVGEAIADWYAKEYSIARPVVVRNIPLHAGGADPVDAVDLKGQLGIPRNALLFIYQGLLHQGRRVEQFLRVFSRLGPDRHLLFLGYGALAKEVQQRAAKHPNIHFLPAVPPEEVLRFTAGADVGLVGVENVCLSYYYSLPNKLFEYLGAGLPVVAPRFPEISRVVEEGDCGWLVEDDDDAWHRVLSAIDVQQALAARERARSVAARYSWQDEAKRLTATYRRVLEAPRFASPPARSASAAAVPVVTRAQRFVHEGEEGYQRCTTCIMDTTDPWITFDEAGRCNHCLRVDEFRRRWNPEGDSRQLEQLIDRIKRDGRDQDYDVVSGLSGGVDSSFMALQARKFGLRTLIVHVDTGWNSELAVKNIENIVNRCGFDLYTHVVDWEEMQDLQHAFFRASVPNQDIPQDHAIYAGFVRHAAKHKVKWNFSGSNFACESILPPSWGYDNKDLTHISDIHRRFGRRPLQHFPRLSHLENAFRYQLFHGLSTAKPLDLMPYRKADAIRTLEQEVGWRYYGGKHYESRFTKFFQAWYLPTKWGYDKRLAHLSSLVVSGQMTRESALEEFRNGALPTEEIKADKEYMARKLGVSLDDFESLMTLPNVPHENYARASKFVTQVLPSVGGRLLRAARRMRR